MGLGSSVPVSNKTYTQEEIKQRMKKILKIVPDQQSNTYSTLNFNSIKGGSVINDIINNNSSDNYLIGGNYNDSVYDGLNNMKSALIKLSGGKNSDSEDDTSSVSSDESTDSSDSTSSSDKSKDEVQKKVVDDKSDSASESDKKKETSDDDKVQSTEGNIFANTKIMPFYSSDTSTEYNFQYPYSGNKFDV